VAEWDKPGQPLWVQGRGRDLGIRALPARYLRRMPVRIVGIRRNRLEKTRSGCSRSMTLPPAQPAAEKSKSNIDTNQGPASPLRARIYLAVTRPGGDEPGGRDSAPARPHARVLASVPAWRAVFRPFSFKRIRGRTPERHGSKLLVRGGERLGFHGGIAAGPVGTRTRGCDWLAVTKSDQIRKYEGSPRRMTAPAGTPLTTRSEHKPRRPV